MQPNIVVCLLDAARATHLSCYGYERDTTPFVDQLAQSGTIFRRAFANSIFSLPSYASLFTGEYPTHHGALDWESRIQSNTLVEGLADRGYETHAVSTHLLSGGFGIGESFDTVSRRFGTDPLPFDDDPVAAAMEEKAAVDGWDSSADRYLSFLRLFASHPSPKSAINGGAQFLRRLRQEYGYWDDDGAAAAVDRTTEVIRDAREPFFCFTNFVETHDPYRPPRSYIRRFLPEDVSFTEVKNALDYSSARACAGLDTMDADRRDVLTALYDAELAYLDDQLADLYGCLEEEGLLENTVFVVCADHGDFFGEHGLWGHQGRIYTQVAHVPLVVSYPWDADRDVEAVTELRQVCDHLHSLAAGDQATLTPAGEAIVEYYGWDTQLSYDPWDRFEGIDREEWSAYQCLLVDDSYSLLWDATGRSELYDVRSDFEQTEDVSAEHPSVVEEYRARIADCVGEPAANHERYRSRTPDEDGATPDEEVQARLRELGYVD
jgi:arylsulfatase A-like enzyme